MRVSGVALLLLVGLVCSARCRQLQVQAGQDIPARCLALSVTAVSCASVPPHNLMAHPDDCELFYYCVSPGSAPVCRQCPAHLHFNPSLRVCDHPAAAGCVVDPLEPAGNNTSELP